jgi:AcrR family transcriptional regulator
MARRPKDDPAAPQLTLDNIVRSSVDILDEHGLEGFSLRAVARTLGAGNMSVYYYVSDRDALLALVLDDIFGTVSLNRLPNDPLAALAMLSKRFVGAFAAHPGTIPLLVLRPIYSIGRNATAVFDRFVGLLRQTGLPDDAVASTTIALIEYLCGHLIGHLPQVRGTHDDHGMTVDHIVSALPDGAAPNIHAIGRSLRRAVITQQPTAGIELFLAGLRQQTTTKESAGADRRRRPSTT